MEYIDQMNRTIRLEATPRRIVSLVPSQTELLHDLELDDEVIGITKFCIHPENWFRSKTRIGGTKTVNIERVRSLNPDLIIANKEENTQADIEQLEQIAPVWISDIHNLDEALDMIIRIGELTNRLEKAKEISQLVLQGFERIQQSKSPKNVLYLIWENPIMGVGANTFIHDMITRLGWKNVLKNETRYPELMDEDIPLLNPDLIILSSEPYPYKQAHIERYKKLLPTADVQLLDGEFFSWYGSRLVKTVGYFEELLSK